MKGLVLWLMTVAAALGVETAGWRIPLEKLVEDGLKNPKVKKLEAAPAKSAFFEEGDELWDLSGAVKLKLWGFPYFSPDADPFEAPEKWQMIELRAFRGAWLVWNARSGMIVGRGTLGEMALVDDTLDLRGQPIQIRTSMKVGAAGKERRVSAVSRSGEKSKVETEAVDLEVATVVDRNLGWMDLQLAATMDAGEGIEEEVQTAVMMKLGEEMKVAAWKDASRDWGMTLRGAAMTVHGVPVGAVRLMEREGRIVAIGMEQAFVDDRLDGMKFDDGLGVRLFYVPPDFVARITEGSDSKKGVRALPDMKVPERMKERLTGRYIDISSAMKVNGVKFEYEAAVAGFDPRRAMVLMVNDGRNLDLGELICSPGLVSYPPPVVVLHFDWEDGSCMLVLRSGEKASIIRKKGDQVISSFEAAPNVSGDGKIVDLNFYLKTMGGDSLNTAVTLAAGTAVEVGTFLKDGVERKVTVTAQVLTADLGY